MTIRSRRSPSHFFAELRRRKVWAGREMDHARCLLRRSAELDPLTPMYRGVVGWVDLFSGDFGPAIEGWREWQAACEQAGLTMRVHFMWLHAAAGDRREAHRLIEQMIADSPAHIMVKGARFFGAALAGDRDAALAAATPDLMTAAGWDDFYSLVMADSFALIGERDEAFRWLEHTIDYGFTNLDFLESHDPFLAPLRGEERFREMMRKAGQLAEKTVPADFLTKEVQA